MMDTETKVNGIGISFQMDRTNVFECREIASVITVISTVNVTSHSKSSIGTLLGMFTHLHLRLLAEEEDRGS